MRQAVNPENTNFNGIAKETSTHGPITSIFH